MKVHCKQTVGQKIQRLTGFLSLVILAVFCLDGQVQAATPKITAGDGHTVALMSDGTVKAWGNNYFGQLGNGSTTNSSTPVTVAGLGGTVTAIAAGYSHTVALMSDGTVKAWGNNEYGQLGNSGSTPVTVTGLSGTVTAIAAGYSHTVALMSDGTVKAWGNNSGGRLGNGSNTNSSTPVTVAGLGGTVAAIAAGGSFTVALMSNGTVKVWGNNNSGQLGDDSTTDSYTPVTVAGLGGTVAAIAAGSDHTVALMSDGTVKAWGYNVYGQLGNGSTTRSSPPVTVTGLSGTVTAIAAGGNHTVALMSDGTVKAWGSDSYGQLGNGGAISSSTPVTVASLGGTVTAIAAGGNHTVALMSDGTVKAWGRNDYGQLGNGSTTNSSTPVTVIGLSGTVIAIAAGYSHTVALMSDGTVKAWGNNFHGQLGNSGAISSSTPVTVAGLGSTVTAIAAGDNHTVALMSDGTVKAWGNNFSGQLGNGSTTNSSTPVTVTGLSGVATAIAASGSHTVALMSDGTVKAWGNNFSGQLGNGSTTNSSTPVTVIGLSDKVTVIAASSYHTVALLSDGMVKAWGNNSSGQLGNGSTTSSSTPVTVAGLGGTVTAIAVSNSFTVALMPDGTIKSWGHNIYGQLGNSSTTNSSTPVTVTGLSGVATAIAAGGGHTVALMSDGTVKAWGYNGSGQLAFNPGWTPVTALINLGAYTDITSPIVTATPAGGTYTRAQNVTLAVNEPAIIYYTLDGSTPTFESTAYNGPITIFATATLKFFGRDTIGNSSTVQTAIYTINISVTPGSNVVVNLPPAVKLTFTTLSTTGNVSATAASNPPPPTGATALTGTSYDITSTATYSGLITVTMSYDQATLKNPVSEAGLLLYHFTNGNWVNITTYVDTFNNTVTGVTTSLSPFIIMEPDVVQIASAKVPVMEGWWLVPAAFMGIEIMRRRRKSQ